MDDVSLASAILIAVWIFFVTALPHRGTSRSQSESSPARDSDGLTPIDDWNFDPSKSDGRTIEQAEGWVLR